MCKQVLLLFNVLLFGQVIFAANVYWDNGCSDNKWSTAENWDGNSLPTSVDQVQINLPNSVCVLDTNETGGQAITVGYTTYPCYMEINSGAVLNFSQTWGLNIGWTSAATGYVTMNGGQIGNSSVKPTIKIGNAGKGSLTLNGGTIIGGALQVPSGSNTYIATHKGNLTVNGGTIYANSIWMNSKGLIDVREGSIVLDGNNVSTINDYIDNGWIIGYTDFGSVEVDYNSTSNKTVIRATLEDETVNWDDGGSGSNWTNAGNWDPNIVPIQFSQSLINKANSTCLVDSEITGGKCIVVGQNTGPCYLDVNSGAEITFTENWGLNIGWTSAAYGYVTMNGGNIGNSGPCPTVKIGNAGSGTLTINGGTINAGALQVPSGSNTYFSTHSGTLNLNGGTINATSIWMNSKGNIDIEDGVLKLLGDVREQVYGYIDEPNGWITAYDGLGGLVVDYNSNSDQTVLSAYLGAAEVKWDDDAIGDNNWTTAINWNTNQVPTGNGSVEIDVANSNCLLNDAARAKVITVGKVYGPCYLQINSGASLNFSQTWGLNIGWTSTASGYVTMNGGTIGSSGNNPNVKIGNAGSGTLTMNGGVINAGCLQIPSGSNTYIATHSGKLYLNAGTITAKTVWMNEKGLIDIKEGILIIDGYFDEIEDYIKNGWIKSYGGRGDVIVDYNRTEDYTIVTSDVDLNIAWNPKPADCSWFVSTSPMLTWAPGDRVANVNGHRVYWGTNWADVNSADTSSDEYKGSQDSNSYNLTNLNMATTYYWRIDEVNGVNVWKGDVWEFTTESYEALCPSPVSGVDGVFPDITLTWVPGTYISDTNGHRVYWGTNWADVNSADTSSDEYKGSQDSNSYNLTNLDVATTYYWRIDEVNGVNIWKGDVWEFTTKPKYNLMSSDGGFEDINLSCSWWQPPVFEDDFENSNFDKWTDGGSTDWDVTTNQYVSTGHSGHAGPYDTYLITDNVDTSNAKAVRISFWYRDNNLDDDDNVYVQLYDGANYDCIPMYYPNNNNINWTLPDYFELANTSPENTWQYFRMTLYNSGEDAQYFHSNFRIKFEGTSIDVDENLWIDDVMIETNPDIISDDSYTGDCCVRLDSNGEYCRYDGGGEWISGKTYIISVKAKASNISGGLVNIYINDVNQIAINSNTSGWQEISFQYTADANRLFCGDILAQYSGTGGEVLLDDWLVQQVYDSNMVVKQFYGRVATADYLRNPSRGFRYQYSYHDYTTPLSINWNEPYSPEIELPLGLPTALSAQYLDDFYNADLSSARLSRIEEMFDNLYNYSMDDLLIFSYRWYSAQPCPTLNQILKHIDQLGPLLADNNDVLFALEAGFIGLWGEWYYTSGELNSYSAKSQVVAAELDILEHLDRKLIIRYPYAKIAVLEDSNVSGTFAEVNETTAHTAVPCAMIGYYDAGFLAAPTDGGTCTDAPYYCNPGSEKFDYMTRESFYVPVEAEMYCSQEGINGLSAAERLRLQHFTLLSLSHAYDYSIKDWQSQYISIEDLLKSKLPVSDSYFYDEKGNEYQRTIFDYINDHLGYRIEIQQAVYLATFCTSDILTVEIDLINRGFAPCVNPRPVYVALVNANNTIYKFKDSNIDVRMWQPYRKEKVGVMVGNDFHPQVHKVCISEALPTEISPGIYKLGLYMPNESSVRVSADPNYAIRVANYNVEWENGVNIIGQVRIIE
jgi:hypothetical protein